MAIADIPLFREARRGQILRSDDWNAVQRELRNIVRTHRHTRLPFDEGDDSSVDDAARQISTDEIADGAVTVEKLSPDLRGGITVDKAPSTRALLPDQPAAAAPVYGTVMLTAGATERVEHGLGSVPVGVLIGVRQNVRGLRDTFDVYGSGAAVLAAVPRTPDGSFTLISSSDSELTVQWWAFTGQTVAPEASRGDR
jgi:hypothetical protein